MAEENYEENGSICDNKSTEEEEETLGNLMMRTLRELYLPRRTFYVTYKTRQHPIKLDTTLQLFNSRCVLQPVDAM